MGHQDTIQSFAGFIAGQKLAEWKKTYPLGREWENLGFRYIGQGQYFFVFHYQGMAVKIPKKKTFNFDPEIQRLNALEPWDSFEKLALWGDGWLATRFVEGELIYNHRRRGTLVCTDLSVWRLESDLRQSMVETPYFPLDLKTFNLIQRPDGQIVVVDTNEFIDGRKLGPRTRREAFEASLGEIQRMIAFLTGYVPAKS